MTSTPRSPHSDPGLGPWRPLTRQAACLGPGAGPAGVHGHYVGGRGAAAETARLHPEAAGALLADLALAPPPKHSHLSLPAESVGLGRRAGMCGPVLTELEKQLAGEDPAVLEKGDSGCPPVTARGGLPWMNGGTRTLPREVTLCRRPLPPGVVHVLCSSGPAEGAAPGEAGQRAERGQAGDPLVANHKTRAFKQNSELRQTDTWRWAWKPLHM